MSKQAKVVLAKILKICPLSKVFFAVNNPKCKVNEKSIRKNQKLKEHARLKNVITKMRTPN